MKQMSAILIALVLLFQATGGTIVFHIAQYRHKYRIKERIIRGMPDERLVRFIFPADEAGSTVDGYEWLHEHEFRYDGQMYDVVRSDTQNGRIVLYCFADDAETERLAELKARTDPDTSQRAANLLTYDYLQLAAASDGFRLYEPPYLTVDLPAGLVPRSRSTRPPPEPPNVLPLPC